MRNRIIVLLSVLTVAFLSGCSSNQPIVTSEVPQDTEENEIIQEAGEGETAEYEAENEIAQAQVAEIVYVDHRYIFFG